jgi:hypothetical protein
MRSFEEYQREFANLTAGEGIAILSELSMAGDRIIVPSQVGNVMTTPMKLCFKLPYETPANTVGPLQFCGGPPGQYDWIEGSLATMVMDHVMHHDAVEERRTRIYGTKIAVSG